MKNCLLGLHVTKFNSRLSLFSFCKLLRCNGLFRTNPDRLYLRPYSWVSQAFTLETRHSEIADGHKERTTIGFAMIPADGWTALEFASFPLKQFSA